MPVFQLSGDLVFPPPELSTPEGILAVGGDLSPERLLLGYRSGIFPWYNKGEPIIWWSPDPRLVIYPDELIVAGSMKKILKRKTFRVTFDRCFRDVMKECSLPRKREKGTWITPDMLEAYCELHRLGYAHSVEAWSGEELAGGLYGVSLGKMFFGESMFFKTSNASKTALIVLNGILRKKGFKMIDSQVHTPHLESMGAREIPRKRYLNELKEALNAETLLGHWDEIKDFILLDETGVTGE